MKNQSKDLPQRLTHFTNPFGCGYLNYLVEQSTNEQGETIYIFESVKYSSLDRNHLIETVIRDKYSQSQVEAIFANYLSGNDTGEYNEFQNWRNLAKAVADGEYMKADLEKYLTQTTTDRIAQIESVQTDIVTVLNEKGLVPWHPAKT